MKRKIHIDWLFKSAALACLVMGYASCADDEEVTSLKNQGTTDVVTFDISTAYKWVPDVIGDSRSVVPEKTASNVTRTRSFIMDCEGDVPSTEIYMYVLEENIPVEVDTISVDSRTGTDEELNSSPIVGVFATHTVDGDTKEFMNNIKLDETYGTDANPYSYWPGTGTLKFYAYSPFIETSSATSGLQLKWENNQATFNYTVPTTQADQYDLMDGVSAKKEGNSLSNVEINLSHLMSQIEVKGGTLDVGTIKSVSFKNIYSTGTRTMGNVSYTWNVNSDDKSDYSTNLNACMFLMPQELSEDASIEIVIEVSDSEDTDKAPRTYTLTKKLKNIVGEWKSNKKYTYVISTPEEVEIEIDDKVDGKVKSDLEITNTGLSSAYIRVTIEGSWVVDSEMTVDGVTSTEQLIVADWKETDGVFNWGSAGEPTTTSTKWRKGSDGYYYYMKVVPRGTTIEDKLFETYTLTANPPMADAYLELTILAEAVFPGDLANAEWPVEIENDVVANNNN